MTAPKMAAAFVRQLRSLYRNKRRVLQITLPCCAYLLPGFVFFGLCKNAAAVLQCGGSLFSELLLLFCSISKWNSFPRLQSFIFQYKHIHFFFFFSKVYTFTIASSASGLLWSIVFHYGMSLTALF